MTPPDRSALVADVCAATAALIYNTLPSIQELPAPEQYRRLCDLLHTAFLAYFDALGGWHPPAEPSAN